MEVDHAPGPYGASSLSMSGNSFSQEGRQPLYANFDVNTKTTGREGPEILWKTNRHKVVGDRLLAVMT